MEFSPQLGGSKPVLMASHRSNQPELMLFNPHSGPVKGDANPNDGLIMEPLGSTGDPDRESAMSVSEDKAGQRADESNSDSGSGESATDPVFSQQPRRIASHVQIQRRQS